MPYEKVKVDGYKVRNKETGRVHAKDTSKARAAAQVRLLRGVEHGMVPRSARGRSNPGTSRPQTTRQAAGLDKETRVHKSKHKQSSSRSRTARGRAARGGRSRR